MSDFEQLLNNYLDFEEFEYEEEDYDIQQKEEKRRVNSPFTTEDSISMTKFVTAFLGYQMDCKTLYHSGLRELNLEYVIGVDNNFANKNPEYVKRGFLLIVIDGKNNRGTYLNPVYIRQYLAKDDVESVYNAFHRLQQIEFEKIQTYYEKYREAQIAYEELKKFTEILKETHKIKKVRKLERGL